MSHACDRTDHGHGRRSGVHAAYEGKMEIWSFLHQRFPALSGYECEPSLRYSRINPGPRTLLPGGYLNEFITGPMVSPWVWGSLAIAGLGDARRDRLGETTAPWYSASALDYNLRRHFCRGVSFGTINGSAAQRLSRAPAGYVEAFRRNLLYFKQYRHLLFGDVFHPLLTHPTGWEAIQYVSQGASESVMFVFRHEGGKRDNLVRPKGLQPETQYVVTRLNERPGREKRALGGELMGEGLAVALPDEWLTKGDGLSRKEYEVQGEYGSDILLFQKSGE